MNIKVRKTETHFEITNSLNEKIWLSVDHKTKKAEVTDNHGKNFCFLGSEPAVIQRMGELISEAGRIAIGEFFGELMAEEERS